MFMMLIKKQSHNSVKPKKDNNNNKFNGDNKTKIIVVGNSLVKYLQWKDLSSKKYNVKVITYPGSTTEDMLDTLATLKEKI